MNSTGYTLDEVGKIQARTAVGNTPLIELRNITALARRYAAPGRGARIFAKDEAANPSGSFKARRAACAVAHAKKLGYKGVMAATSGNYGAAVASQAAMQGMECIVVQECYDSRGVGQPEIIEKARKCEAYGAEVVQLSVGPELFYSYLTIMQETGYFNASLYSPFGIAGVETLGYEIATQCREMVGRDPDMVVCTNAGGGMITGTARGLIKAGSPHTTMVAASIDLVGLHMASDSQFNKKSCTTGHTGFGVPYATDPDHSDTPRSAARSLRYMDRYVTVKQGEVFYCTEMLANLEGLERGPAGNTALAAAFSLAQEMPEDGVLVISETEYTGAGKHIQPQLSFARDNGIEILFGDPATEDKVGVNIVLPKDPGHIKHQEADITRFRQSLIKKACARAGVATPTPQDLVFLAEETKTDVDFVKATLGPTAD
ncbi:MAG: PLP-dependent lyase/thiolase [Planctomycetaceae bacterium]|nr:PLP-dependent lyase/thiolase [Planctomycetaceae bacterium]